MVKMNSLIVNKVNYKNMSQCWGCRKIGESDKFCSLHSNLFSHSICMECYNNNIENKLKECINCAGSFLLDYTKLKENDIIKYGFDEFMFCYNCLSKKNKKCIGLYLSKMPLTRNSQIAFDEQNNMNRNIFLNMNADNKSKIFNDFIELLYQNDIYLYTDDNTCLMKDEFAFQIEYFF